MSHIYRDFGTFSTSVVVEPGQADEVFEVVDEIAQDFRSAPVDTDLLERARKPLLEKIALSRRENGWWLGIIDEAQLRAERLDRVRSYEDRIRAITPEMLQQAALRYLDPAQELRSASSTKVWWMPNEKRAGRIAPPGPFSIGLLCL